MRRQLFLASVSVLAMLARADGQATNTGSTTKPPEVFLDNHRPLVKKKEKAPTSRNVAGKVVDHEGAPLEGALVTLTNTKTETKNIFITKTDGRFNFEELSLTVDYQLQARYKALNTDVRKISQFDPNVNTVRILQVDTTQSAQVAKPESKATPPPQ